MNTRAKTFLVSTADFAFYVKGVLACTGVTNLDASIEVSMQEQNINAGKGSRLVYSYMYGRELAVTLQSADWKLEFIAANVGSPIVEKLTDRYVIGECVDIVEGVGTLKNVPIGDVAVELPNGSIVTVQPTASTIDLTAKGITEGSVLATYQYNANAKTVTIDESTPYVGKLVLDADKCSNELGKVGSVQIVIPSYQLSGNFTIEFTPDGVTSTNLDGRALAIDGEKCSDGSSVYAYINEFDDTASAAAVNDIAATPSVVALNVDGTQALSVIGLKGGLYAPIQIDNAECTFTSDTPANATVTENGGVITGVQAGSAIITVEYGDHQDVVQVTVS